MYKISMKIAVAVSGGVDSLYALINLKEQRHDVLALHARFIDTSDNPVPRLQQACDILDVPLHVADLRPAFKENVIKPFFEFYQNAKTPNPCALCNKTMKFGLLAEEAKKLGAEKIATGHYACLSSFENSLTSSFGYSLKCGEDSQKDQSYFLALTPLEQLRFSFFPLSHRKKEEIKKEIEARGIEVPCPKESQEVCFVPNDNYRAFLTDNAQEFGFCADTAGSVLYYDPKTQESRKIAEHKGLWAYTEGQRKGLGIAWTEPLYVLKRNSADNALYVSTKDAVTTKYAAANNLNFLIPPYLWSGRLYARTRFREKQSPCKIYLQNIQAKLEVLIQNPDNSKTLIQNIHLLNDPKTRLVVEFDNEKQIYAPGQVLAVYDENGFVLAGGILI